MIEPLRRRFTVHSFDVDAFQTLSIPALAGYLEEVAARHADLLGCGLDLLRARGCTWVLIRQRLDVPDPIVLGDELEVETWPSGIDRLQVSREFLVRRAGTIVARCSTAWIVVDLATRRPLRPADVLDPSLRPRTDVLLPLAKRLATPDGAPLERSFDVRYLDIDANLHVNNTSYLVWALEAIAPERWRTRRVVEAEVHFVAESRFGDRVRSHTRVASPSGSGPVDELSHTILREGDGLELARVRTRWAPRPAAAASAGSELPGDPEGGPSR